MIWEILDGCEMRLGLDLDWIELNWMDLNWGSMDKRKRIDEKEREMDLAYGKISPDKTHSRISTEWLNGFAVCACVDGSQSIPLYLDNFDSNRNRIGFWHTITQSHTKHTFFPLSYQNRTHLEHIQNLTNSKRTNTLYKHTLPYIHTGIRNSDWMFNSVHTSFMDTHRSKCSSMCLSSFCLVYFCCFFGQTIFIVCAKYIFYVKFLASDNRCACAWINTYLYSNTRIGVSCTCVLLFLFAKSNANSFMFSHLTYQFT